MNAIYDSIIYGFLLLDGVFFVLLIYLGARSHKRKSLGLRILLVCSVVAWGIIFYGSFIEPRFITTTEQKIELNENSINTLHVVLVSDFHVGPYKASNFVAQAVEKINTLKPDIILLAGDFLFGEEVHTEYLTSLGNLRAPHGIYAVLGNHDYEEDFEYLPNFNYEGNERVLAVVKLLEETGIKILRNTSVEINIAPRKKIILGGVDEVWTYRADIAATFKNRNPKLTRILLTHNPDIITKAIKHPVDLVLAGHAHGGQIRLPLIGPVPPIPTKLGRKYDRGLFQFKNLSTGSSTQMFITSGLGESGPRARLFVPPEIAVLNIEF